MVAVPEPVRQRASKGMSYLRSISERANREAPFDLNINIMYQSAFACLFVMALFSLKPLAEFVSSRMYRTEFLDFLALNLFDVFFLQLLFIVFVAYIALLCLRKRGAIWAQSLGGLVYPLIGIVLLMIIEVVLEKLILKPTFSFNRPSETIGEPWFTSFLRHYYGFEHTPGSSTPSGFIVRQTILALLLIFLIHQKNFLISGRNWKLLLLHSLNITVLLLMAWLRIYTGAHRLYDAAIAVGIGGFLFWVMAFIFLSYKDEVRNRIADFALPSLTFAFMILLYSQDFVRWIVFCAVIMIVLSLLFHKFTGIVSGDHEGTS